MISLDLFQHEGVNNVVYFVKHVFELTNICKSGLVVIDINIGRYLQYI